MENNKQGYENLIVWQRAMDLVVEVYKLIRLLPKEEKFGLGSQIGRCAVSMPSNIAEGFRRQSDKSFRQFLLISFGSGAELETQIMLVKRLDLVQNYDFIKIDGLLSETMKMLSVFIAKKRE
jgi:four helix bundle protein